MSASGNDVQNSLNTIHVSGGYEQYLTTPLIYTGRLTSSFFNATVSKLINLRLGDKQPSGNLNVGAGVAIGALLSICIAYYFVRNNHPNKSVINSVLNNSYDKINRIITSATYATQYVQQLAIVTKP